MKIKLILIALFGVMLFSSCEKLPQNQIDQVSILMDSVKLVGGELYVPEEFMALNNSFETVKAKIEEERSKIFKNYNEVIKSLDSVNLMASDVLSKVEVRKVELIAENDLLLAAVKDLISTNNLLLSKAPSGKDGSIALKSIKSDIDLISTTVTETEELISNDDILGANNKIKAAKEKALELKNELESAISKIK